MKKEDEAPFILSADDIDPKGEGLVIGKAPLSDGPGAKQSVLIFPQNMSKEEAAVLLSLLMKACRAVSQNYLPQQGGEDDHDFIELALLSGRKACLAVPKWATPEELAEVRGDMMSLIQEGVLEDAITEAKAQPIKMPVGVN
jgi:hypothetical protein